MFKKILLVFLLITTFSQAQHTIKGELHPAENYPWMILYQLQGAKQNYIAHDSIKNGKFSIAIPNGQPSGMYRLIYDIKNRLFVDIIYANEDVSLTFNPINPNQSVQFSVSENNKLYQNYLKETQPIQKKLDSLQVAFFNSIDKVTSEMIAKVYHKNYIALTTIQQQFETKSTGKLIHDFIKASARYNAENPVKNPTEYLTATKNHFFDTLDFNNETLLNSTFINDKINDFIFYLNTSDDQKTRTQLYKKAITTVIGKINTNQSLTKDIEEGLLYNFTQQEDISMVNYIINFYLQLPKELQDNAFIADMKGQLKTTVGTIAPNILWTENNEPQSLHKLNNASHYIVVFWSSTCGHCLKELPLLESYLQDKKDIKVIAIGLETEESKAGWQTEIAVYNNWIHVYGKNKWKNQFAREYGVNATPSFFILDAKKKILVKPDDIAELKVFFEMN